MDSTLGAALVGAGSSVLSGLGNLFGGNLAYKRAQRLQAQQAEYASQAATTAFNRQQQLINEQNAYNDPMASRARLENAGYNPFLTNLDGSGQQPQAGSAPMASMPEAPYQAASYGSNFGSDLAQGFQSVMDALNKTSSTQADVTLKNEEARKAKMINDAVGPDGKPLVLADYVNQLNQSKVAEQTANSLALQNRKAEAEMVFLSGTYHDENGNPVPAAETGDGISDADGNYTVYGFMQKNKLMGQMKEVDKLFAECAETWSKVDVNNKTVDYMDKQMSKIDEEIKTIKGLRPYQIQQLKVSIQKLYSDITTNQALATKYRADAKLATEQATTESESRGAKIANITADTNNKNANTRTINQSRPYVVNGLKWDSQGKMYGALQAMDNRAATKAEADWINNHQGLNSFLIGTNKVVDTVGNIGDAAMKFGIGLGGINGFARGLKKPNPIGFHR